MKVATTTKSQSKFIKHTSCDACGSSDAGSIYEHEDGRVNFYCFSCKKSIRDVEKPEDTIIQTTMPELNISSLRSLDIPSRGIGEDVMKIFGCKVECDENNGLPKTVYFPYFKEGEIVGWKVRSLEEKRFWAVGDIRNAELFGQQNVQAGNKLLIITEGEFDALAAKEMLFRKSKNYAVVSIPNGASGAKRAVQDNMEFVESFSNVVLAFDMDDPGKQAAKDVAEVLSPGKVKIASYKSGKDANELLLSDKETEFLQAINSAKEHRPDGIVRLSQTWDELWKGDNTLSIPYPWSGLNKKLYGIRPREIVVIGSGSGLGKSSIMRELQYHLFKNTEDNIGILALEENVGRTNWGILSIEANAPLHIREERKDRNITTAEVKSLWDKTIGTGRFVAYDHWGSTSEENLLSKIRYMIKAMECKWIFLDHISIVVSDSGEISENERIAIDTIMTRCRSLVEETGAGMFIVTHLKRPSGKGHEKGAEVELSHFRGSGSIAHLADISIAGERNQQDEDEKRQNLTKMRVLKNRYSGSTGVATHLFYDKETGRLGEVEDVNSFLLGVNENNWEE
jgi:twinkle protein